MQRHPHRTSPPAASAPPPVQGAGNATLTVVNNTSSTVCLMRISPATSSDWWQDWLGSNMISSGSSYDFDIATGSYDLRAEFCGNGEMTQMGVSITSNYAWTLQWTSARSGPWVIKGRCSIWSSIPH